MVYWATEFIIQSLYIIKQSHLDGLTPNCVILLQALPILPSGALAYRIALTGHWFSFPYSFRFFNMLVTAKAFDVGFHDSPISFVDVFGGNQKNDLSHFLLQEKYCLSDFSFIGFFNQVFVDDRYFLIHSDFLLIQGLLRTFLIDFLFKLMEGPFSLISKCFNYFFICPLFLMLPHCSFHICDIVLIFLLLPGKDRQLLIKNDIFVFELLYLIFNFF